jgi:hypothetical protein
MKFMKNKIALIMAFLLSMVFATSPAFSGSDNAISEQTKQIQNLISITFDQPDNKVVTAPVVVVRGYAIADWIQGDKGGRALLRLKNGEWELIACGGDGFKEIETLKTAGIPADIANDLIKQLNKAEQSLSPSLVKKFGLFGATKGGNMKEMHQNLHH